MIRGTCQALYDGAFLFPVSLLLEGQFAPGAGTGMTRAALGSGYNDCRGREGRVGATQQAEDKTRVRYWVYAQRVQSRFQPVTKLLLGLGDVEHAAATLATFGRRSYSNQVQRRIPHSRILMPCRDPRASNVSFAATGVIILSSVDSFCS